MVTKIFVISFPNDRGDIADIFEIEINQVIRQKLQEIFPEDNIIPSRKKGHIVEDI